MADEVSLSPPNSSVATHLQNDSQRVRRKFRTHFLRIAHAPLGIIRSHLLRTDSLLKPLVDVFLYLDVPSRI